ncbi:hypothetical protein [Schaalia sp. ZJ1691]|uniref:hypothetical protein n=1 Tax=Schaalia sp. ZJ1691 TaxID=2709404 RepID=UPI0013EB70F7|nr:hypothetical protein [Schaalia sp. ZJ1691]
MKALETMIDHLLRKFNALDERVVSIAGAVTTLQMKVGAQELWVGTLEDIQDHHEESIQQVTKRLNALEERANMLEDLHNSLNIEVGNLYETQGGKE